MPPVVAAMEEIEPVNWTAVPPAPTVPDRFKRASRAPGADAPGASGAPARGGSPAAVCSGAGVSPPMKEVTGSIASDVVELLSQPVALTDIALAVGAAAGAT